MYYSITVDSLGTRRSSRVYVRGTITDIPVTLAVRYSEMFGIPTALFR
jgi:hypothetical protein